MTETREQWIEREAAAARKRWRVSGEWDGIQEHIRQDWRNVVAPYYQEPLRVPVDVDGLAKAMCDAANASAPLFHLDWDETLFRDSYRAEARAALTYLNIEPCDKPEYDPADVAFRDALKKSQEIVNNWTPEQRNHNSIGYAGLQDNERAELENLRAECKRLRHEVEVERDRANDLLADKNWAEAECGRLQSQQPETRPAKVRFDVMAGDLAAKIHHALHGGWPELSQETDRTKAVWIDTAKIAMDHLSAHAVLEVPPGVPSVEELVESYRDGWDDGAGGDTLASGIAAVRDAIIEAVFAIPPGVPSAGEISTAWAKSNGEMMDGITFAVEYLQPWLSRSGVGAGADVPPGVPPLEELARLVDKTLHAQCYPETRVPADKYLGQMHAVATAVRDRILAGIQRREWTDADVEELAKVMYETSDAYGDAWKWDDGGQCAKNTTRKEARAALAWFDGKRGEV